MARPVVLVSNRGPVAFRLEDGRLVGRRGGGGLVSGLAPLVAHTDALWIAAALTDADRAAAAEGVIEADGMRVRTLDIAPHTLRPAYDVVANSMLWFLHHGLHDLSRRPVVDAGFRTAWAAFRLYNEEFADVIAAEAPADSVVLAQDYHLSLLGPLVRARRPDIRTVHFSHTPFAPPMQLRTLPHDLAAELLEGIAANHACGFHSVRWARDFAACCEEFGASSPTTFVAPLAADEADLRTVADGAACAEEVERIDAEMADRRMILRIDRLELSKNLLRGFRAYDLLLERRPDLHEHVVFRALGYPSREGLAEYLAYRSEVESLVAVINHRWATPNWTPIELDLRDDFPRSVAHLRRYDVLLVNPIRDGLNLVAAEGPLVNERNGTVVLSREAGIHDQLADHVVSVNPFDIDDQACALGAALDRTGDERRAAATALGIAVRARTPADWLADQLAAAG